MTVIKINAITVPADSGDELAHRFAARAGAVDDQPGFEGFELLKPTDEGRHVWLVVTRWADEESFQAWLTSRDFAHGHGQGRPGGEGEQAAGQAPHGHGEGHGQAHGEGHGEGHGGSPKPVGLSAELWGYEVAGGSTGRTS
ncbi:antibiotic biosynthesis monooxygenase family protein [Mobilicoccus caccae]|uniref:Monooxygenase n=1 Tax=Mobilicoccus caccae TaxID=1859295 RepID=A0ABQ6IY91_9MICO|nr:antibiotic biosynthesis monooxygenase [Mobilicoccus caccae]GMA41662.1 monooxygenase [Mobilicoccus caccae]